MAICKVTMAWTDANQAALDKCERMGQEGHTETDACKNLRRRKNSEDKSNLEKEKRKSDKRKKAKGKAQAQQAKSESKPADKPETKPEAKKPK